MTFVILLKKIEVNRSFCDLSKKISQPFLSILHTNINIEKIYIQNNFPRFAHSQTSLAPLTQQYLISEL